VGLVTQSARFYCRPVREHSWARYFSSASIISSPFTGSLYSLCRHDVFRYCKVKFSGQDYAERTLRNIRWFIVRRLMPRYYTPPLLSRFPIIRLYCYSFPSSLFPESIWSSWLGGCISLPVNLFRLSGYSLVYSTRLCGQLGSNAHGRPSTISGSSSFVSADDVSLVSF